MMQQRGEFRNLIFALGLSIAILAGWQYFVEMPKIERARQEAVVQQKEVEQASALVPMPPREALIEGAPRLKISTPSLHGSIALKGALFDDLTLVKYRTELHGESPEVVLLSPSGNENTYFMKAGWVSPGNTITVPDDTTLWQADHDTLTAEQPITLSWNNGKGQIFRLHLALDADYLFTIRQEVVNESGEAIQLQPFGYVNRAYPTVKDQYIIQHEGPLGVLEGGLKEIKYKTLREDGKEDFRDTKGWLGITDKYWLTALIPAQDVPIRASFSHYESKGLNRYQADYLARAIDVPAGATSEYTVRAFAGAKELKLLDRYSSKYDIPLFDRAVDLGMLYFLTKPIFLLLLFFHQLVGNFGVAILLLTVVIRLILFPLANKSYKAMGQMKKLQPEMLKLKERHAEDKMKMNQELMALYKKEKVNPAAGCLPMFVQIPVFFALYKVLFVTIEMRHAPFFGWLKDLSVPDPSNLFTLFGILNWTPPSLLHLGILPILMSITMYLQQKLSPAPTDPVQARVMKLLPLIFLFLFASFPAGLVLYWVWSNTLSIGQQYLITRKLHKPESSGKS